MSTVALYKNFINEAEETDSAKIIVKGKMKLFISPQLESLLKKMLTSAEFQVKAVANKILNIDQEPDENLFNLSYVDINKEKDDEVTYLPVNRAYYLMKWKSEEEALKSPPIPELWYASGRQSVKVGKFINNLFDNFSEIAVDKFINAYKAEIAATMIYNRFKLVTGEEIRFWYSESNYFKEPGSGGGNLGQSCMRYDSKSGRDNCQPYFDIYCKNPEKCAMLILTNTSNKLLGRALVWNNLRKPTDKTFMDRIYAVKQPDEELFKKYAQERNWLYKHSQQAHDITYLEDGQRVNKSMATKLNPGEYKTYPYMDTFKYYNPTTGRLGSDPGNPVEGTKRLKLEQTGGASQKID